MRGRRPWGHGLVLAISALAVIGCGESGPNTEPSAEVPTLASPEAEEPIEDAAARVERAAAAKDCEELYDLNPVAAETLDVKRRCDQLRTQLEDAELRDAEEFEGGGVADFDTSAGRVSAPMIADRDGRLHLTFVDPFLGGDSVGTPFDEGFDKAAKRATKALAEGDCAAFRDLAYVRFGPGATTVPEKDVCAYAEENPIAAIAELNPEAEPVPLGGNADYALYGFAAEGVHFTMLFARQTNKGAPPKAEPVPRGRSELAFVTAYETNLAGEEP